MIVLSGLSGTNPRDFLAAVGLLRLLHVYGYDVRLSFCTDGSFRPQVHGTTIEQVVATVVSDTVSQAGEPAWRLRYDKQEKAKVKSVRDLKAPPGVYRSFMEDAVDAWLHGRPEAADYAAAYATDVGVDGKGNTKPTAFHMTAGQQEFIKSVEDIRDAIDADWVEAALIEPNTDRGGANLRWDPDSERMYALMAHDPTADGTTVCAPREWLAFRALPLFPVVPRGSRVETTGVHGRGEAAAFRWPLWDEPASLPTVSSLVRVDWARRSERGARCVMAVCVSSVRRTTQGYGNLGPASVIV